jgi:2-dehydropantoate 2-reductase
MIRTITVVGLGGIGGFIAGHLAGAREAGGPGQPEAPSGVPAADPRTADRPHLTFLARGAHLAAIRSEGLRLESPGEGSRRVRPDLATDRFDDIPTPDLVFVCVKAPGLPAVARGLAGVVQDQTAIVPLLNGADIYERIRAELAGSVVLPACIYVSARIRGPGVVEHLSGPGMIHLGPDPRRPGHDPAGLLDLLAQAGVPFRWHPDPAPAVWTKYVFIASFALVTAAHRVSFGPLLASPALRAQAQAVMEEIVRLAGARGVALPPDVVERSLAAAAAFPPDTRTSYQRDIEARAAANEGDLFAGTILRLGREYGVATPATAALAAAIERSLA